MLFKKTANMVAVVKVKTREDKLAIALVDTLANILAEIQVQTLGKKLVEVLAKAFLDTMKDHSRTQCTMWKLTFWPTRWLIG